MTLREFLKELEKTRGIWTLSRGRIRTSDGEYCPLSFLVKTLKEKDLSVWEYQSAAQELGISSRLRSTILEAADGTLNMTQSQKNLRARMLEILGLKERKLSL